jgi:hypothetical protein
MSFNSVDQITNEFELSSDNPSDLLKKLKRLRLDLHPDNNAGEFCSKEDEVKFLKIGTAIDYLNETIRNSKSLVPVSEIKDLIEVVSKLIPNDKVNSLELKLSDQINASITKIKSQRLLPKITVSSLTAILTALWVFPSTISEHTILKNYVDINSKAFSYLWLCCLISTVVMWIRFSITEAREKDFRTRLNTESVQNKLFEEFLYRNADTMKEKFTFTKDDFINSINSMHERRYFPSINSFFRYFINPFFLRGDSIDIELAQSLANVIFTLAEQKKIIQKSNSPSLSDQFLLTDFYLQSLAGK